MILKSSEIDKIKLKIDKIVCSMEKMKVSKTNYQKYSDKNSDYTTANYEEREILDKPNIFLKVLNLDRFSKIKKS